MKKIKLASLAIYTFQISLIQLANAETFKNPTIKNDDLTDGLVALNQLPSELEEVLVTGGHEAIRSTAGSAHLLDSSQLEKFEYTDLNNVLTQVPGVYIRYEDGFGLRPNIGMRGATAERSQKITIMEDGIVITPSPYAAPAAYYIPNVSRMEAIETFKGPSAIKYGPHTVGGAINMASRTIPQDSKGEIDATLGNFSFHKLRVFYGDNFENTGYWIEGLKFGSDGFKELDTGGDTGFDRNDFNAKFQIRSDKNAKTKQRLDIKVGYADETSDETYLGLTDEDFDANPDRRYAASQLDQFNSEHTQLHLLYNADFQNGWKLDAKTYFNRFERAWERFNGFTGECFSDDSEAFAEAVCVQDVLANPEIFTREIALLHGEVDSDGSEAETIGLVNNDREYGSQGIEINAHYQTEWLYWDHEFSAGIRFHHDYVDRDHSLRGFLIEDSNLIFDGIDRDRLTLNRAEADALSIFLADSFSRDKWKFDLGLRIENIDNSFEDELIDESRTRSENAVIPGLGVFYQWTEHFGLLAGIYKGFSPSGPSAAAEVDPEESTNVEYGFRFYNNRLTTEIIGFFSDYENLLGRCRASDSGCDIGDEFNGGAVEVAGLEWVTNYEFHLSNTITFPVNWVYTYTETAFQTDFDSSFSQWGNVREGDELPYIPEHVARLDLGVSATKWSTNLGIRYTGEMREVAGQGEKREGEFTEDYTILDLSFNYALLDQWNLVLKIDNLTDEREIVSRRPIGARPNISRAYSATVKYNF